MRGFLSAFVLCHAQFPILPPTADVDPSIRHEVEVQMPTRLSVQRTPDSLTVSCDTASLENVKVTVGKKMSIGMKDEFRVYIQATATLDVSFTIPIERNDYGARVPITAYSRNRERSPRLGANNAVTPSMAVSLDPRAVDTSQCIMI